VGLVGVTLAAVFSAAMSTLSSSLNSSASAAVNDLYLPWRKIEPESRHALIACRAFTIVFGVVQIIVGIAASHISRSVVDEALAIAGFTAGILLGIFALGVLTRRVQQPGALTGLLGGLAVMTAVKFATPIAWTWFAVIGATCTFAIGYTHSLFFPPEVHPVVTSPSEETTDEK
jgi:Na+/proline symporter